jgi:hypothetical protein
MAIALGLNLHKEEDSLISTMNTKVFFQEFPQAYFWLCSLMFMINCFCFLNQQFFIATNQGWLRTWENRIFLRSWTIMRHEAMSGLLTMIMPRWYVALHFVRNSVVFCPWWYRVALKEPSRHFLFQIGIFRSWWVI